MTFKEHLKGPSKLMAIIIYILFIALLGSLFVYLCLIIVGNINNLDTSNLTSYYFNKNKTLNDNELNSYYTALGLGNSITYLFMAIGIIFYLRDEFKTDFINILKNKKFYLLLILISSTIFCIIQFLLTKYYPVNESQNQDSVVSLLKSDAKIPMILSTLFLAPIAEEAFFRKCLFHYLRIFNVIIVCIIQALLFALLHMLSSTNISFTTWILTFLLYFIPGILLGIIYIISKKNIYPSFIAHMLNNLMALILVFI